MESFNIHSTKQFPELSDSFSSSMHSSITDLRDQNQTGTFSQNNEGQMEHEETNDSDTWKSPSNPAKMRKLSDQVKPIPTKNSYETLCQIDSEKQQEKKAPPPKSNTGTQKPPPLYVYGIQNKFNFSRTLAATCQIKPIISHTQQHIRFQAVNYSDFEKLKAYSNKINSLQQR